MDDGRRRCGELGSPRRSSSHGEAGNVGWSASFVDDVADAAVRSTEAESVDVSAASSDESDPTTFMVFLGVVAWDTGEVFRRIP